MTRFRGRIGAVGPPLRPGKLHEIGEQGVLGRAEHAHIFRGSVHAQDVHVDVGDRRFERIHRVVA